MFRRDFGEDLALAFSTLVSQLPPSMNMPITVETGSELIRLRKQG
jgi:hypothetical protein